MSVRFIQAPPSGCRSFSRHTGHYLETSHKPRKNRHDVSRKGFANKANRKCSLDKQKKTPERQSLMNSHWHSRWINLDLIKRSVSSARDNHRQTLCIIRDFADNRSPTSTESEKLGDFLRYSPQRSRRKSAITFPFGNSLS